MNGKFSKFTLIIIITSSKLFSTFFLRPGYFALKELPFIGSHWTTGFNYSGVTDPFENLTYRFFTQKSALSTNFCIKPQSGHVAFEVYLWNLE